MTHLSLFTGIGGLDLAAEAAGFTTVGQCEWADYPTKILEKHWPDVPRWRDIRTLTGKDFYERTGLRTIDVVSGGFPCQPFSNAGKRRGEKDDRYLWPEMLRVLRELRPRWVVGENVAGIVNLALDTVLADLEDAGYSAEALIVPACAVDAPHRRDRVAIVAYCYDGLQVEPIKKVWSGRDAAAACREDDPDTGCERLQGLEQHGAPPGEGGWKETPGPAVKLGEAVSNAESTERERHEQRTEPARIAGFTDDSWWPAEPGVGRVAHGIPNRVDRIKCLGNAVVPQQFYPFFAAIAKIEKGGGNAEGKLV